MIKVVVEIEDGSELTYLAPDSIKLYDGVSVDINRYGVMERHVGIVVELGSDYEGWCREIVEVRRKK